MVYVTYAAEVNGIFPPHAGMPVDDILPPVENNPPPGLLCNIRQSCRHGHSKIFAANFATAKVRLMQGAA